MTLKGKTKSYYNFLLKHEGKTERFKMTSDIINKKNKRKWLDFEISKIKEPVYGLKVIDYNSTDTESSSEDSD